MMLDLNSTLFLDALIDGLNDGVVAMDRNRRVVEWNSAAEQMFGYSRNEVLGRDLDRLISGRKAAEAAAITRRAVRKERIVLPDAVRFRKDGKPVFVSISISPIISGRRLLGTVAVYRDITGWKKREDEIRHISRLFRALGDISQLIVHETDPHRLLRKACAVLSRNGSYDLVQTVVLDDDHKPVRFSGIGQVVWKGKLRPCAEKVLENGKPLFIPDVREDAGCAQCRADKAGWAACFPLRHRKNLFGILHIGNAERSHDIPREVRLLEEIAADLGYALWSLRREQERRAVARELTCLKEFHEHIVQSLSEGILLENERGTITFANPALEALLGLPRGNLAGRHWSTIVQKDEQAKIRSITVSRQETKVEQYETRLKTRDGREVPVLISARSVFRKKRFEGVLSTIVDIADLKKTQEKLRASREKARAADRAKSEFLANMSHEIRTPMNGIMGMIELALDTSLTSEQRDFLKASRASAQSLLTVLNDILDFSKIEAHKIEIKHLDFNLHDTMTDIVSSLALSAHRKGLELKCRVPPSLPGQVKGDPGRIRQVLVNLVANAIKFTKRGEVVVDVVEEARSKDRVSLLFSVKDTGIGIPKKKQKDIFNAFVQADGSMTRSYEGTGLGLAISSRLVDLMGGTLGLESRVGKGSLFSFTLDLELSRKPRPRPVPPAIGAVRNLPVLIVDDNEANRIILREWLMNWKMRPSTSSGALSALKMIRKRLKDKNAFRMILVDLNLPGMDGFRLVEKIRGLPGGDKIVILMLTSADRSGDRNRSLALGIADYLVKPLNPSDLYNAVLMALGSKDVDNKDGIPTDARILHPQEPARRILLAEDNLISREAAKRMLQKRGYEVETANDGRTTLDLLDKKIFDLVLMDVQMPDMDGLEVTRRIRSKEQGKSARIPIVALTAHAMKGDRERCLAAGMDDYLPKPVNFQKLDRLIAGLLAGKRNRGPRENRS